MSREIKSGVRPTLTRKEVLLGAAMAVSGLLSSCTAWPVSGAEYESGSVPIRNRTPQEGGKSREKPTIVPEEGTVPLAERKVEVPGTVDFVDMDLSRNETEVGNWTENKELKYGEFAEGIPGYDFSKIKELEKLDLKLEELYSSLPEAESDPNVRKLEFFVGRSAVDQFNADGVSFVGWMNRHGGFFNSLLAENGLDLRTSLGRMVMIDDGLASELVSDLGVDCEGTAKFIFGTNPYSLPPGYHNRMAAENGDYRNQSYYSQDHDLNFGYIHNMNHFLGDVFLDIYPLMEHGGQMVYRQTRNEKNLVLTEVPELNYPADWLMVLKSLDREAERPVLSPISVALIKHLEERGVSSWKEAVSYWCNRALFEIDETSFVQFKDPEGRLLAGKASIFIGQYLESVPGIREYGRCGLVADFALPLDPKGRIWLPPNVIGGYASYQDSTRAYSGREKNFVFAVETDGGEVYTTSLTSLDFLLATWEAKPKEYAGITVTLSEPVTQ